MSCFIWLFFETVSHVASASFELTMDLGLSTATSPVLGLQICYHAQSTMAPNLQSDLFGEGGAYLTQHLCGDQRVIAVGSLLPPLHGSRV